MIDPTAIIALEENSTVETPDGPTNNVSRIAVWDWYIKSDGDGPYMECHTNNGDVYVDPNDVERINRLN